MKQTCPRFDTAAHNSTHVLLVESEVVATTPLYITIQLLPILCKDKSKTLTNRLTPLLNVV